MKRLNVYTASRSDEALCKRESKLLLDLYEGSRLEDAEKLARTLTIDTPRFALGWKVLGSVYARRGQLQKSVESFRRLLKLDPKDFEAHNLLALSLQAGKEFSKAEISFKNSLRLNKDYLQARINLGLMYYELAKYVQAESCFKKVLRRKPKNIDAKINLGSVLLGRGDQAAAEEQFRGVLSQQPDNILALNNLANLAAAAGRNEESEAFYRKVLKIKPRQEVALYNLANVLKKQGKLEEAEECYLDCLSSAPEFSEAHNNLGMTQVLLGKLKVASESFLEAFRADPRNSDSLYNYAGTCDSAAEAAARLTDCLAVNPNHVFAKLTRAALLAHLGQKADFAILTRSQYGEHSFMRSFQWAFGLPKMPSVYINRWQFFDEIAAQTDISRPFYEFGVWRAHSFRYLMKTFKKGFGFDTFTGLPEDWKLGSKTEGVGSYSSGGSVPEINGAEFIVGQFEQTLPEFFSGARQVASLINFDADLYSSTLCALVNCKKIIDESTILIFDEFILNESWEDDEYRALEEFCELNGCVYDVVALSFFTKQVAVKLRGI